MSQRQQCDMMVICTSVHSNGKCSQVEKLNGAQLHFPLPQTGEGGKWFIGPKDTEVRRKEALDIWCQMSKLAAAHSTNQKIIPRFIKVECCLWKTAD